MEKVTTDVLIIGGGLAAMMAALEASTFAPSLLMVSKGKIGKSGATLLAGSNFAAVLPEGEAKGDTVASHIQDTLSGGGYINDPNLVRTLAENAPRDLLLIEELGVVFLKREGRFELRKPPGHNHPRTVFTLNPGVPLRIRGKTVTDPLRQAILRKNITLMDGITILRLIVQEGTLAGAIAFDRKSGETIAIECKAGIIASGGAGCLYEMHTNPNDLTGDSYSLLLEAGCPLRDIEFVQFFPSMIPFTKVAISGEVFIKVPNTDEGMLLVTLEARRLAILTGSAAKAPRAHPTESIRLLFTARSASGVKSE